MAFFTRSARSFLLQIVGSSFFLFNLKCVILNICFAVLLGEMTGRRAGGSDGRERGGGGRMIRRRNGDCLIC